MLKEKTMKGQLVSRATMMFFLATAMNSGFAHGDKDASLYKGYKGVAPCPTLMGGVYVGAQVGYEAFRIRQSVVTPDGSLASRNSLTGWLGGLFLGYGQYFNERFYLGGEVLANYNGKDETLVSGTDDGDSFSRKLKVKGTWGLALIPGLKLNPSTLGYLRLGYDWTNLENTYISVDDEFGTANINNNFRVGGFNFGVGIETLVQDNWSVRAQYKHIWYDNRTSSLSGVSTRIEPSNDQFSLGLVYRFC